MENESDKIVEAMKNSGRIIAVDLDGTLAEEDLSNGWRGYKFIGKPIMSVVKYIRKEKRSGSRIVLNTCRISTLDNKISELSLGVIRKWLKKHKVPVDEIWMSTGKPYASIYLDDKAVNPCCEECTSRAKIKS